MSGFGLDYAQVLRMIKAIVLDSQVARDIVRKSGLLEASSGVPTGIGSSVLSASWVVEPREHSEPAFHPNDRYGILWDPVGGFPTTLAFWPTGEDAVYSTITDLTGYPFMRNVIIVDAGTPHPDLNVRVEASLDGIEWSVPTVHDSADWLYAGCNVNLGNWPAIDSPGSASGGCIHSEWQRIANEFRVDSVRLRWFFFVSPADDGSPYDPSAYSWGALKFGYADVQVG